MDDFIPGVIPGQVEYISKPFVKLKAALDRGASFVRITKQQMRELQIMLGTAVDDRGLPIPVECEITQGTDGTVYLTADVIFKVRPDGWPDKAPKAEF